MPEVNVGELGYSGTRFYAGQIETNEHVSKLIGLEFFDTIDKMRNDAGISGIESGFFLPIQNGKVSITYDIPKNVARPARYDEIKAYSDREISNINKNFLTNALLFLPYGFMPFEQVFSYDVAGRRGLKKLAPRLPKTIHSWKLDDSGNNIVAMNQYVYRNNKTEIVPIPVEKLLILTHKLEGGNIEGKSEYRSFYREYTTKDRAYIDLRIIMQRLGNGIPWARLRKEFANDEKALDKLEEVFQGLQNTKEAYIAFDGTVEDHGTWAPDPDSIRVIIELIKHCDESICKSAIQMFTSLGTSATGSRALGDTFTELYYMALDGTIFEITEAINEQVLKPLIIYNFGPQDIYPKVHITIEKKIDIIIERLKKAKDGGLIAGNSDLENWILEAVGVPLTTEENKINLPVKPTIPIPTVQSEHVVHGGQCSSSHHTQFSDKRSVSLNRKPTAFEASIINFDDVVSGLNNIKDSLASDLRSVVEPVLINAAKELGKGEKIYEIKVGAGNRVADLYRKYFKRVKDQASTNVKKELMRQDMKMSEVLFKKTDTKRTTTKYDAWADQLSDVYSEIVWNESKKALSDYLATGISKGLIGDALAEFIIDQLVNEVGLRYGLLADKVTGGYAFAREITAEEFKDVITSKVRSEIMDVGTCDQCAKKDGIEYFQDSEGNWMSEDGEPADDLPDTNCAGELGGYKCRGIYIYRAGE